MEQPVLTLVKVGGKIVESPDSLADFLGRFVSLEGFKVLVHGGGKTATEMAGKLGIDTRMVNGRRVTDEPMLKVVTMVYAGLVNKNIVAKLQALNTNALGMTGADLDYLRAEKRAVGDVDYGYVGDVSEVHTDWLVRLVKQGVVPVLAPLSHDKQGHLLNTNADTIAAEVSKALAVHFRVRLIYCFEKKGVLSDPSDEESVIAELTPDLVAQYIRQGIIEGGMIPKLEKAFNSLRAGVEEVVITRADALSTGSGTHIRLTDR
jgi:acetylglutamate kinase